MNMKKGRVKTGGKNINADEGPEQQTRDGIDKHDGEKPPCLHI
jgi:hypothetical protein